VPDHDARAARHAEARDAARRTVGRLGTLRLVAALAAVAAFAWAATTATNPSVRASRARSPPPSSSARRWPSGAPRAARRRRGAAPRGRARRGARAARLGRAAGARLARRRRAAAAATDLHLVGRASLAQLLDVVTPPLGGARGCSPGCSATRRGGGAARAAGGGARARRAPEFLEGCAADPTRRASSARAPSTRCSAGRPAPPIAPRRLALLRVGATAGPALFVVASASRARARAGGMPWVTASLR
jgi:hypothetical protein